MESAEAKIISRQREEIAALQENQLRLSKQVSQLSARVDLVTEAGKRAAQRADEIIRFERGAYDKLASNIEELLTARFKLSEDEIHEVMEQIHAPRMVIG
jgi:hypothetical protein